MTGKRCVKCHTYSSFNYPGKPPKYCKSCKEPGMINVASRRCIGCGVKQPSFNYPNKTTPLYCFDCKLSSMVSVIHSKKCENCKVYRATYNFIGQDPIYCLNCKKPDMVDVRSKRCSECKLQKATYGYNNQVTHCKGCKNSDMRFYNNKKICIKCEVRKAYYNFEEKRGARYCGDCKEYGMVNKIPRRSSVLPMCSECNTNIGYLKLFGRNGVFCDTCKTRYCISVFIRSI